ncbi:MAG: hypothetical protein RLN75_08175 [Longimicrobiales bacterium]
MPSPDSPDRPAHSATGSPEGDATSKRRPRPPAWLLATVLVGSCGVALFIAEVAIRVIMGPPREWAGAPLYVGEGAPSSSVTFHADPSVGWRMVPNAEFEWTIDGRSNRYVANEQGFRSPYTRAEFAAGERRVVVLGDSFTFGTGVDSEDSWPALIDRRLADATVYNMGMPGVGVDQMWRIYAEYGAALEPHVVVLGFVDQDWDRSMTAFRLPEGLSKPTFTLEGGALRALTADDRPGHNRLRLERNSGVWGLVRLGSRGLGRVAPVGAWWRVNAAVLDTLAAEVRDRGARLIVVRIPNRGVPGFPQLARHLSARGVAYLDLTEPEREEWFFRTDDHIDEDGHRFVAESVTPLVRAALDAAGAGPGGQARAVHPRRLRTSGPNPVHVGAGIVVHRHEAPILPEALPTMDHQRVPDLRIRVDEIVGHVGTGQGLQATPFR